MIPELSGNMRGHLVYMCSMTKERGAMSALDIDFVRAQFPAFSEPSLQGKAFFENAGGSYMCQAGF